MIKHFYLKNLIIKNGKLNSVREVLQETLTTQRAGHTAG